jgi:hypothetical protein
MEALPERYVDALPERQERRLVIAIDYGTTYTGIPPASADRHLVPTDTSKQVSRTLPLPETERI